MAGKRGFKEIYVGNFRAQLGSQRVSTTPECSETARILIGHVQYHHVRGDHIETENYPPAVAYWRSNLVALSHKYNVSTLFSLPRLSIGHRLENVYI
jgi:hypothetical protein